MNVCRISPEKLCTEFRHLNSRITIVWFGVRLICASLAVLSVFNGPKMKSVRVNTEKDGSH